MAPEVSRQVFLRGVAGAMAGTVLAGCGQRSHAGAAAATTSVTAPSATVTPAPDWAALNATLRGQVKVPTDPGFDAAKAVFNARFDGLVPAAVVSPQSEDDVRAAMTFASRHDVRVAARSGGHSYVGASTAANAMILDLRGLSGPPRLEQASGLVTISAATQLHSVQTTLAANGLGIPTGSCPSVGAAGLTLGGGLGADARRFGLTCDALTEARVVLPAGDVVTASATEHDDVFWALRGGGGGTVGVTTSLTFRTHAVGDRDVVTLTFQDGATTDVLTGWNAWLPTAPRTVWSMVNVTVDADSGGATVVLATDPGDGQVRADQLMTAIGARATHDSVQTLGHLDFVRYFEGGADATRPRAFVAGSDVIGDLTHDAAQAVVTAMSAWPRGSGAATAVVESLSGAVGDVAPDASAFPWRRQSACIQWYTEPSTPDGITSATAWLDAAHQAVQANSVGGYVNYLEADTAAKRYLGDNLDRLIDVRRAHDPEGIVYSGLDL